MWSLARLALRFDAPAVPLDYAVAHREAEPRPGDALRREEGLEYPLANFAAHPDAVVGKFYLNLLAVRFGGDSQPPPCFMASRAFRMMLTKTSLSSEADPSTIGRAAGRLRLRSGARAPARRRAIARR